MERDEVEGLLAYAGGLDVDAFLCDYEVQTALRALAARVGELKREQRAARVGVTRRAYGEGGSDDDTTDAATSVGGTDATSYVGTESGGARRRAPRRVVASGVGGGDGADGGAGHARGWDTTGPNARPRHERVIDDEALELADALLEANPQLRAVHTRVTLGKVLMERAARDA